MLSPKEFAIFSRIQGDPNARVSEVGDRLMHVVNLHLEEEMDIDTAENAEDRAFDPRAVYLPTPKNSVVCVHDPARHAEGKPVLVVFQGMEYGVKWFSTFSKPAGTRDVGGRLIKTVKTLNAKGHDKYHIVSVTASKVVIEASKVRAFATGDIVTFANGGAIIVCDGQQYDMFPNDIDPAFINAEENGKALTVTNSTKKNVQLGFSPEEPVGKAFNNRPLRATLTNPQNMDNVSVDFSEMCAFLARSLFSSDPRLRVMSDERLDEDNALHSLFETARAKFYSNVKKCLDRSLKPTSSGLTSGSKDCFNLQRLCEMLSCLPLGELQRRGARRTNDGQRQAQSLADIEEMFQDGASELSVIIDLFAFLTEQEGYLSESSDTTALDIQMQLTRESWLLLIDSRECSGGVTAEGLMLQGNSQTNPLTEHDAGVEMQALKLTEGRPAPQAPALDRTRKSFVVNAELRDELRGLQNQ